MTRNRTFAAVALAILVIGGEDLAMRRAISNSVPRQVARRIESAPAVIDVLGIGNSLIQAGFDADLIAEALKCDGCARPVVVNGGLGATGPIEHLELTRAALSGHAVRALIYGFFDQQMSLDDVHSNSDLIGNRSMLYYREPSLTARYAQFDGLELVKFRIFSLCDLLAERSLIWEKVELARRRLGDVGLPEHRNTGFGRASDVSLLEAASGESFAALCQRTLHSDSVLSAPVRALIAQARQRGAEVYIVEMPMHPSHLRTFYAQPVWAKFRNKLRTSVELSGAIYLDASGWAPDEADFGDRLHLAASGRSQFSRLLAKTLIGSGWWSSVTVRRQLPTT